MPHMTAAQKSPEKVRLKVIEEVLPSPDLLAHYKARIGQFEQEREELLRAVDRCAVHQDEAHRLEWENRKRADEVKELQKALSDAQQFLFEERQRLLHVQAENDELKLQEIQDRQRIQQLLAMTQPLEQTITHRQDGGPPSSVTVYPKPHQQRGTSPQRGTGAAAAGADSAAGGSRAQQRPGSSAAAGAAPAGAGGERVLRTVFFPTVDADFLLLKIESLQAQLNEQRQLHEERVAALLADRQLRVQEEEQHRSNLAAQVESLSQQVKQLEDTLRLTTKEYILARREKQDAQAAAAAAQAQMVADVAAARAELAAAQRQARADVERAAASADSKMREYVDKFREQVRAREEELMNLSSLHTATKVAADKRIAELEARVTRLLEANRQLELRRQLDVDGWAADVTALRKTLAAVDRKLLQMRLIERLDDDERLDKLLDQLEKRMPGAWNSSSSRQQAAPPVAHRPAAAAAGARAASKQQAAGKPKRTGASSGAAAVGLRSRPTGRDQRSNAVAVGRSAAALQAAAVAEADLGFDHGLGDDEAGVDDADVSYGGGGEMDDEPSSSSSSSSVPGSVKSGLAAELRSVRQQLQQLELRAGDKARRALAGGPPGSRDGGTGGRAAGQHRALV